MFFHCPASGKICLHHKSNLAYKIINGMPTQMFVCDSCSIKENYHWQNFVQAAFTLTGVDKVLTADELNYAISTIKTKEELNTFITEVSTKLTQPPCVCGTAFRSLLETGRPGCPTCYTHFYDFMRSLTDQVQGKVAHVGKRPKDINTLKSAMEMAVKEERYEDAAKIRDQIRSLDPPPATSSVSSEK